MGAGQPPMLLSWHQLPIQQPFESVPMSHLDVMADHLRSYNSNNLEGCPHKNWVWLSSPVLSLPVAVHRADTVATIPFVDLEEVLMDMCCFGLCWGDFWNSALVGRPGWCSSCRTSNRQSPCQRRKRSQCCYNPSRSKFESCLNGVFLWPGSKAQSRWRCWCHRQSQKLKTNNQNNPYPDMPWQIIIIQDLLLKDTPQTRWIGSSCQASSCCCPSPCHSTPDWVFFSNGIYFLLNILLYSPQFPSCRECGTLPGSRPSRSPKQTKMWKK